MCVECHVCLANTQMYPVQACEQIMQGHLFIGRGLTCAEAQKHVTIPKPEVAFNVTIVILKGQLQRLI